MTKSIFEQKVVCGLAADSNSVHQADNRLPAMRLRNLWYLHPSLHVRSLISVRTGKVSAACACCRTYSRWTGQDGLDWGAATPVDPRDLGGSTPWGTSYKVVRSKQGFTASLSLSCLNTAVATSYSVNW